MRGSDWLELRFAVTGAAQQIARRAVLYVETQRTNQLVSFSTSNTTERVRLCRCCCCWLFASDDVRRRRDRAASIAITTPTSKMTPTTMPTMPAPSDEDDEVEGNVVGDAC